nr:retrovirus-related Pol polyprotein from transposon TNT 1-94 [Tanacetum cinerariifolium]
MTQKHGVLYFSSQSQANSSYSPQPYYVTHPSSVADYEDEYQGELQGDSQEDKLTTAMMLLARAIAQKFSTPTKMLLAMKDEARNKLKDEENDFMLDNSYGDETLEELTTAVLSEVNASNKVHEQVNHAKRKSIIHTSDDDQIDSNIIFDDPYVENNGGTSEHDLNAHDKYSNHMTGNLQLLRNFVEKFMGTVRFRNDHFVTITGYVDYVQGNLMICHVYYVEDLSHNLFSVKQFCDRDLEVAFRSNTCYVWNLEGDDLLIGSRESNLYSISIFVLADSSLVCLMSKGTLTKSWLWHQRLSHLNFGTINQLTSNDLVDGLLKFKYNKDHLCSVCVQRKRKKASLPPKLVPSTKSKLELIHMDLYRPMRVEDNFAANTLDKDLTSSTLSIVVEEDEAPQHKSFK